MSSHFPSLAIRRGLVVTFSALTLAAVVATPNALAANSHANAHATTQSTSPSQSHADGQTTTASDHSTQGTSGTSGVSTQPQPTSNADQNSGGANGLCPGGAYCSTRDGTASGNGNGGGNATGKPCAGCVGKADNKNPAGQAPNGTDANAGYECDRNHGIGRSNPAHTGCATTGGTDCTTTPTAPGCTTGGTDCTTTPTAPGCTTGGTDCTTTPTAPGCTTGGTDCTTTPTAPGCTTGGNECAALPDLPQCVTVGDGCAAATVSGDTCTAVLGEKVTKTRTTSPAGATNVLGEAVTRTPSGALPFTGVNVALMSLIASIAILGGVAMTVVARKRRSSTV